MFFTGRNKTVVLALEHIRKYIKYINKTVLLVLEHIRTYINI